MAMSCRTCLIENNHSEMFSSVDDKIQCGKEILRISQMIALCCGLEISQHDEMTNFICENCISDVKYAYLFRQQCWLSESFLKTAKLVSFGNKSQYQDATHEVYGGKYSNYQFLSCDSDENHEDFDSVDAFEIEEKFDPAQISLHDSDSDEIETNKLVLKKIEVFPCNNNQMNTYNSNDQVQPSKKLPTKQKLIIKKLPVLLPKPQPILPKESCSSITSPNKRNLKSANNEDTVTEKKKKYARKPYVPCPTVCDICGQVYSNAHALRSHVNHTHLNIRQFQCTECSYQSHTKHAIQIHMRTHTKEKPYQCDLCENKYRTSSARFNHRRTHFDERPFICEICGKGFKKQELLHGHKKIHDPNSRKQCKYCDKTFIKNDQLKHHEMTHTNERPHKCLHCKKGFIQKSYLRVHQEKCIQYLNKT